jgi:succinate dehydrogenase / fumarate reductase flavoprotein subunit
MRRYAPNALDLAPRDVVARAIQTEIDQGRGFDGGYVHLVLTHIGEELIASRLPGIREIAQDFAGVDPVTDPIPVQPAQHYSMGGISVSIDGATGCNGLYAAGECACVSVHGANRLGGNSLLETVVFGRWVAQAIARDIREGKLPVPANGPVEDALSATEEKVLGILARPPNVPVHEIRDRLTDTVYDHFGIFRQEDSMREGLRIILELKEQCAGASISYKGRLFNQALVQALELEGMILLAEVLARGAIARRESRGSHARTDYPERDDHTFLRHTVAALRDGAVEISYAPVTLGMLPPRERTY